MNDAAARARLQSMVAASEQPTLSSSEIDDLLLLARRVDTDGNKPHQARQPSTAYAVGELAVPNPRNAHVYKVTVAGQAGSGTPTWPTAGGATVVDGTVTWQEVGDDLWVPNYNLRAAAAEGWRWKAGKQAAVMDIAGDGQQSMRGQIYQHCIDMAERYSHNSRSVAVRSTYDEQPWPRERGFTWP